MLGYNEAYIYFIRIGCYRDFAKRQLDNHLWKSATLRY